TPGAGRRNLQSSTPGEARRTACLCIDSSSRSGSPSHSAVPWPGATNSQRSTLPKTGGSITIPYSQDKGIIMPRVRPERFVHVVYRTRRFEQMLEWYQIVFDSKIQHQNPALAFLTYDDEHHRFAFANLAVLQPGCTAIEKAGLTRVDDVAYIYASLEALFENYAQLEGKAVNSFGCLLVFFTVAVYYAAPDVNQME